MRSEDGPATPDARDETQDDSTEAGDDVTRASDPAAGPATLEDPTLAADPQLATVQREALGKFRRRLVVVLAVAWVLWQSWFALRLPLDPMFMRSLHLSFAFALTFLMIPGLKWVKNRWVRGGADLFFVVASVIPFIHLILNFRRPDVFRLISPEPIDIVLGFVVFAMILIGNWRASGPALPIVAGVFLFYMFFGDYLPMPWGHSGTYPFEQVIGILFLRLDTGILGVATAASTNLIFPVLVFGGVLIAFGAGSFLSELTMAAFGRFRGAPAKISVASSAGFATVTGTGPANVAATGVFTIPLMKRGGYQPHFAAAVESTASIGGQLLPPVMGAGAFVMAEFLSVPYSTVITHAVVPAVLYFLGLFLVVDLRAAKMGLKGYTGPKGASVWQVLRKGWHFPIPVFYLLYVLIVIRGSIGRAAIQATLLLIVLDLGRRLIGRRRLELSRLVLGCVEAAKGGAFVGMAVVAVMVVISTLGMTGTGIRLSRVLVNLAGGELLPLLLMTAVASILLGAGLPVVATYLVLALITAPAITTLGVPLIAAHFFVFYLGVLGDLSPPTALAPTIAAGIARANLIRVTLTAMLLGAFGFILPFIFVYQPELLLIGDWMNLSGLLVLSGATFAVFCFAVGLEGYLFGRTSHLTRLLFIASSVMLIFPTLPTTAGGFGSGAAAILVQWFRHKRGSATKAPTEAEPEALTSDP